MESGKVEVEFVGIGGQGIVLASLIVAEAAAIAGVKNVMQSRNYGPERSGSRCRCEVLFSDQPIIYPKAEFFDLSLVLSLEGCYDFRMKKDALIVADDSVNKRFFPETVRVVQLPFFKITKKEIGDIKVLNLLALGFITEYLPHLKKSHVEKAIKLLTPQASIELNLKAFNIGMKMDVNV